MNFIDPSIWLLAILIVSLSIFGAWCWYMLIWIWREKS
jgi:hypothetical protein